MSSRHRAGPGAPRGPFPRPNLTMRELIGLVLAFAVSNAFLSWILHPVGSWPGHGLDSHTVVFGVWNGMLAFYLGFAFLQAWIRSVLRWRRTGDAAPPGRRPRRWTALGVAEATVIGGTMFTCSALLLEKARNVGLRGDEWGVPAAILLIGAAAAIMILRMWRRETGKSLTGRGADPTIGGGPRTERGEAP
jgi:hypothetical protein